MLLIDLVRRDGWGGLLRRGGLAVGGLVAEDGGEDPEVVGMLGPEELMGKDGWDGVVDYGGEDGYGGSGREVGEEGGVGDVGEAGGEGGGVFEGVAAEVSGEGEGEDGQCRCSFARPVGGGAGQVQRRSCRVRLLCEKPHSG